jgi:hypothetical protein
MSLSNTAETAILNQIFVGTALPWNGNTDLWIALYESDPGEGGSAVTGETTYGSYARIAVARSTGFTVSGNSVENAGVVTFVTSTAATANLTYAAIVTTSSGAGTIIVRALLNNAIPTTIGVQPQFAAGALSFTID